MIMPDKPDYNSKDLRLHRKYILVVCFILIFLKYGGVKLDQVSLLGTSFRFENEKAIFLGLWIILFYSMFRYYQFFRHESWGHVQSEFREIQSRFYQNKFLRLLSKNVEPRILEIQSKRTNEILHLPSYFHGIKSGFLSRRFDSPVSTVDPDREIGGSYPAVNQQVSFKYNLVKDFFWQTLRASWHFIFNTPFFFEFLFPFLLLMGTLIYCGLSKWEGSLVTLFSL